VQAVPEERLLIETDAPDTLERTEDPSAFLRCGYEQVAKLRGVPIEQLAAQVATNFTRYFLDD
jgi:Tat protein secretion system quality control protein TatD with DNase activity